jgi:hypothetical protein
MATRRLVLRLIACAAALLPGPALAQEGILANHYVFTDERDVGLGGCLLSGDTLKRCLEETLTISGMMRRVRQSLREAQAAKARGGSELVASRYMARMAENRFLAEAAESFPQAFEDPAKASAPLSDLVNAVALEVMDITGSPANPSLEGLFHETTRRRAQALEAARDRDKPESGMPLNRTDERRAVGTRFVQQLHGRNVADSEAKTAPPAPDQYLDVVVLEAAAARSLFAGDFAAVNAVHEAVEAFQHRLDLHREAPSPELTNLRAWLLESLLAIDSAEAARQKNEPRLKPN